jgi:hypothetical protein
LHEARALAERVLAEDPDLSGGHLKLRAIIQDSGGGYEPPSTA